MLYSRRENVILSPNCCSVTIFEYSSMSRCYIAVCQVHPSQSKWQSAAKLRSPKTSEEEEKCVASAIPR